MLVDSLIVPECVYRPGSFTGLMTIYESSFLKLHQLVGGLEKITQARSLSRISQTSRDCDLFLDLVSCERYTTTLKLTYLFEQDVNEPVADPDLTVRVYHDARLAEVTASREAHRHVKLRELALAHSLELGRRWRNNIMLNKWLDYLLDMGHAFR